MYYGVPGWPEASDNCTTLPSMTFTDSVTPLVDACHHAGLLVAAWNCNRALDLPRIRATGVDWLGTDLPTEIVPAASAC